ncbi:hypothetical protein SNEBB_011102 [Seison nebaliae]|nr:hypothetical protein SNEBB_011102 [Seison nebaliae]
MFFSLLVFLPLLVNGARPPNTASLKMFTVPNNATEKIKKLFYLDCKKILMFNIDTSISGKSTMHIQYDIFQRTILQTMKHTYRYDAQIDPLNTTTPIDLPQLYFARLVPLMVEKDIEKRYRGFICPIAIINEDFQKLDLKKFDKFTQKIAPEDRRPFRPSSTIQMSNDTIDEEKIILDSNWYKTRPDLTSLAANHSTTETIIFNTTTKREEKKPEKISQKKKMFEMTQEGQLHYRKVKKSNPKEILQKAILATYRKLLKTSQSHLDLHIIDERMVGDDAKRVSYDYLFETDAENLRRFAEKQGQMIGPTTFPSHNFEEQLNFNLGKEVDVVNHIITKRSFRFYDRDVFFGTKKWLLLFIIVLLICLIIIPPIFIWHRKYHNHQGALISYAGTLTIADQIADNDTKALTSVLSKQ